jgi:hypothetical protein
MLVEPDAGAGLGHDRRATSPCGDQADRAEGRQCIEEYALVSAAVTDEIERGNAIAIAGDSFAADDAGARAQEGQRLDD